MEVKGGGWGGGVGEGRGKDERGGGGRARRRGVCVLDVSWEEASACFGECASISPELRSHLVSW